MNQVHHHQMHQQVHHQQNSNSNPPSPQMVSKQESIQDARRGDSGIVNHNVENQQDNVDEVWNQQETVEDLPQASNI